MNTHKFKITVTGGAGYLGSILVPELLKLGHQVTIIDNFLFKQVSLLDYCYSPNLTILRGDCRNEDLIKKATKDADFIIPLAALVGAPLCNKDPLGAKSINEQSIEMLCNILEPKQKILYPTTNSGYGIGEKNQYCNEETPLRPISEYGRGKVEAERIILERGNCITFRLATVFGMSPRMRIDLLVNDFVYRAVNDSAVVVFEGHFKRNYIHIRDVARAFIHGIENFDVMKDKPYNIGLEEANLSKIELCQQIQKQLPHFVYMEAPIGEDPDKRDYLVSNKRIMSTGFKPQYDLADGVRELIKGYNILKNNIYSNI